MEKKVGKEVLNKIWQKQKIQVEQQYATVLGVQIANKYSKLTDSFSRIL